ncbi:MAG TPA: mechanosensitive ion channel family protein, partial [Candidatus Thermoplasmatota archaeon]|nr:mechanosensitive ion channel family protein [Candidatus Thermoplasmatota archaeon]
LDMAFWVLFGIGAILLSDVVVRVVTARTSNAVTREIITKLRRPVFYAVIALGVARSFHVLPTNPVIDFLERTLVAIAVGVFGLYVLYKALDAALFYYQQEIGPRTQNKFDDVLVPVIRKVGLVVLYVVGIIWSLKVLGWDPTIIFAGAGIAGLVIAFAAQDTFSNLFSGIFLMLDQPFKEGDDIQLESNDIARVEHVGLRTTRLYDYRTHQMVTVPNNQLATRRIINLSGPDKRYWAFVEVGVAYGTDLERVREVLLGVARTTPGVLDEEGWRPSVFVMAFADSSINFSLRFGIPEFRQMREVASRVRFGIDKAFKEQDIQIPFPQRTVWLKDGR